MRLIACRSLALHPISATWYRAIAAKHLKSALQTSQTALVPSRFNPGNAGKTPFEIRYLAENQIVAFYEVGAIFGPPHQAVSNPLKSKMIPIDVEERK